MGISLTATEALEPKVLRETVERLDTDPSYRARVSEFQKELRDAGGHHRAADALQQFVTARQGPRRNAA